MRTTKKMPPINKVEIHTYLLIISLNVNGLNRLPKKKNNKVTTALHDILDQMDLTGTFRTFHS